MGFESPGPSQEISGHLGLLCTDNKENQDEKTKAKVSKLENVMIENNSQRKISGYG